MTGWFNAGSSRNVPHMVSLGETVELQLSRVPESMEVSKLKWFPEDDSVSACTWTVSTSSARWVLAIERFWRGAPRARIRGVWTPAMSCSCRSATVFSGQSIERLQVAQSSKTMAIACNAKEVWKSRIYPCPAGCEAELCSLRCIDEHRDVERRRKAYMMPKFGERFSRPNAHAQPPYYLLTAMTFTPPRASASSRCWKGIWRLGARIQVLFKAEAAGCPWWAEARRATAGPRPQAGHWFPMRFPADENRSCPGMRMSLPTASQYFRKFTAPSKLFPSVGTWCKPWARCVSCLATFVPPWCSTLASHVLKTSETMSLQLMHIIPNSLGSQRRTTPVWDQARRGYLVLPQDIVDGCHASTWPVVVQRTAKMDTDQGW